MFQEEDEEQEEECLVPLTLTNVEHFVRFCPEISLAQSTRLLLICYNYLCPSEALAKVKGVFYGNSTSSANI